MRQGKWALLVFKATRVSREAPESAALEDFPGSLGPGAPTGGQGNRRLILAISSAACEAP